MLRPQIDAQLLAGLLDLVAVGARRKGAILPFLLCLSTCGTSLMSSRETNPVIQGMLYDALIPGAVEYLAPTASRRLVLYMKKPDGTIMCCAEPPPDVGEAFAATVAGGAQLGTKRR